MCEYIEHKLIGQRVTLKCVDAIYIACCKFASTILVYTQYCNFIIQAFKCIAFRERTQKSAEARWNGDYGP